MKYIKKLNDFLNENYTNKSFSYDDIITYRKLVDEIKEVKDFLSTLLSKIWKNNPQEFGKKTPNREQIDVWSFHEDPKGLEIVYEIGGLNSKIDGDYGIILNKELEWVGDWNSGEKNEGRIEFKKSDVEELRNKKGEILDHSNRTFTYNEILTFSKLQEEINEVNEFLAIKIAGIWQSYPHEFSDLDVIPNKDQIDIAFFRKHPKGIEIFYEVGPTRSDIDDYYFIILDKFFNYVE